MIRFWIIHQPNQRLDDLVENLSIQNNTKIACHLLNLGCRLPIFSRHNGKTDLAFHVNIWVVDWGLEIDLGWFEGIFRRELQVDQEGALVVRSLVRYQQATPEQYIALVNLESEELGQKNS